MTPEIKQALTHLRESGYGAEADAMESALAAGAEPAARAQVVGYVSKTSLLKLRGGDAFVEAAIWREHRVPDDVAIYAPIPQALTAGGDDGEPVATVCLVGDRYAHGRMIEVQLRIAPGAEIQIGTKLYTRPSPVADAEALAERIANVIEEHHPDFTDYMPCARDIARRLKDAAHA